jgi:ribosome-associated translation inhibitor RaiA
MPFRLPKFDLADSISRRDFDVICTCISSSGSIALLFAAPDAMIRFASESFALRHLRFGATFVTLSDATLALTDRPCPIVSTTVVCLDRVFGDPTRMLIKIGGDTLALDGEIRRHIETEAAKLAARFPGEDLDARAIIQEEFDPLHGHRVRCELSAKMPHGRQIVVRDARKTAREAIDEVFGLARRNLRRVRRQIPLARTPIHTALNAAAGAVAS